MAPSPALFFPDPALAGSVQGYADEGVGWAGARGVALDYSDESIRRMEEILDDLHRSLAGSQVEPHLFINL